MSPTELGAIAVRLFGERWQRPLADALGMSPGSVSNWLREEGRVPVPGPASAALHAWDDLFRETGLRPPVRPGASVRFDPAARPPVRGRKPRYARLLDGG